MESFTYILAISVALIILFFFAAYVKMRAPTPGSPGWLTIGGDVPAALRFPQRRYPMEGRDILPLFLITAVYAVVAFWGLGDKTAPQTFVRFDDRGYYADVTLPEDMRISSVMYYTGLFSGDYYLQFSMDGETWTDQSSMEQSYARLFRWQNAELIDAVQEVKYLRIISGGKLWLGELALYDENGGLIDTSLLSFEAGVAPLFDEQDIIPSSPSYLNGTYFDEIYHARTAYEHIENIYPYEVSHPPLGKLIISLGIRAFGMTPFGWRFMGTLFGVLMLPFLFIFIKNMFGSTAIASCGTILFAFDFMHYVQTRISTIDTYAVFFIILMYFFMYRFVSAPSNDPFYPKWRKNLALFLSGLFFGIGAASKWTVIYGAAGLALIWLIYWIMRGRDLCRAGRGRDFASELTKNILFCVLAFAIVPCAVYYVSYYPYGLASDMSGISMFFEKKYFNIVLDNQKFMLSYHWGVDATHPYSSTWYQWLFNVRPILYYSDYFADNTKSAFAAFLNPVVCWGGLFAVLALFWKIFKEKDGLALFILVGYLSQLVPWLAIKRVVFAYHYFPCMIFLVLAICYMFNIIRQRRENGWRVPVYGYTALATLLFVMFYPVLSGVTVSQKYAALLRWIPEMWPF